MRANCHLVLEQLLNCRGVQDALRRLGGCEPRVPHGTRGLPVGTRGISGGIVYELVRHDWSFQSGHHVAERQLVRIACQLVPAMRPAHAAHNAPAAQTTQKLVQIRLGDLLPGGDLGTLNRALSVPSGQLDDRVSPVITAHSEPHC